MKTEVLEQGHLSSQIRITIEAADYKSKFEEELKKYRQKAHIKGFRRGKTPMTAIRKMVGKALLADVINNQLQTGLSDYIVKEELDILGNPLPSEGQEKVDFNTRDFVDYSFDFDLGLAPQLDVKGASKQDSYAGYKVEISDDQVEEELDNLRKRYGTQEDVEDDIQEMDILIVSAVEKIENTQEGEEEEEPFQGDFTVLVERMNEEYQKAVLGQKIGFTFDFDVFQLEKDATEDFVRKHYLMDAPESVGANFQGAVKTIKRLIPAEMNEAFYANLFGDKEVKTEEEAREALREQMAEYFDKQGTSITKRKVLEALVESNQVELPHDFLKRWLLATNENLTSDQIEDEYESFEKNLKWTLIKKALSKQFEIEITPQAIKDSIIAKLKAQFGAYSYAGIDYDQMAQNVLQKQEHVEKEYEELMAEEVLNAVLEEVTLKEKKLSFEEYKEVVQELQQNIG
jgi:trigger factor